MVLFFFFNFLITLGIPISSPATFIFTCTFFNLLIIIILKSLLIPTSGSSVGLLPLTIFPLDYVSYVLISFHIW